MSPETVAIWMGALAKGDAGRRPLARSTINQALCAVVLAHHTAGHALDRKHPVIAETWRGISRKKAQTETIRQAQPITSDDLRAILTDLGACAARPSAGRCAGRGAACAGLVGGTAPLGADRARLGKGEHRRRQPAN